MGRRVLIAVAPEVRESLRQSFTDAQALFVTHLHEALTALQREEFSAVVAGYHFDNYAMFELVRQVTETPKYASIPVICLRAMPSRVSAQAMRGIEHAVKTIGAKAFVWCETPEESFQLLQDALSKYAPD